MWRLIVIVVAASLVTWKVQDWRASEQLARQVANHQEDLTRIALASAARARQAVEAQQLAQQALASLDTKATQERVNALAENQRLFNQYTSTVAANVRLRADVAAGHERLRIAGSCRSSGGAMPDATGTTSVGDAGTFELAPAAGRTVFDIRAGIIADQTALKTLQTYVKTMCQ